MSFPHALGGNLAILIMILSAWLILGIPFAAAALIFFGVVRKPKLASFLATGGMLACFALTLFLLSQHLSHGAHAAAESSVVWIPLGPAAIEFGILLNSLSLLMLLIVTGVGFLIFLYSTVYMHDDPGYARYFASLSLFAFSMLGIVLSNNLIQIFIFWELVGLSSYLLIGFWFEKPEASTAGKKAFITTRVGDVGMMIGILLLFGALTKAGFPTFNFLRLESVLDGAGLPAWVLTASGILIFMGVAGKSAQIPLHVWLPDAMEGPTPVSALIHAATMVAAGVFLLARFFFLFAESHTVLTVITWTGAVTAIVPATIALVQNDIKKILAYSTLSQLGYMVLALGLGDPHAGMFHLTTHAFFKALLFLGAGSLIHAMHTQDIWEMAAHGGTLKKMPVTSWTFLIGTAALMGIPPTSGFFSKEAVLGAASQANPVIFIIALLTVFCTAFYMTRLCAAVFFSKTHAHGHAHESGWPMTLPLIVLAVPSLIAGFISWDALLPHAHGGHHGGTAIAVLSVGLSLAGLIAGWLIYRGHTRDILDDQAALEGPRAVLGKKYFFDDLYDWFVIRGMQENLARISDWFEKYAVIETGVHGTARAARLAGDLLRKLQTGHVQFYALVFAIGATVLLYVFILVKA